MDKAAPIQLDHKNDLSSIMICGTEERTPSFNFQVVGLPLSTFYIIIYKVQHRSEPP